MTREARLALEQIEEIWEDLPGFARVKVTHKQLDDLLLTNGILVDDDVPGLVAPYCLTLPIAGRRRLALRAGLPDAVRIFLKARALAEVRTRVSAAVLDVADVVGLAAVLHLHGFLRGVGRELRGQAARESAAHWAGNKLRILGGTPEIWHGRRLEDALPAVVEVLQRVSRSAHLSFAAPAATLREAKRARDRADYEGAAALFAAAIESGRGVADWETVCLAVLGTGTMHRIRGNIPLAMRYYRRGLRFAQRHELRAMEGVAQHELFSLVGETGSPAEAARLGAAAYEAYRATRHARLPALAHDIARFWLIQLGDFTTALPVFLAVQPHMEAADQGVVWGNIARAAGAAGDAELFDLAAREVAAALARSGDDSPDAARCTLGLSIGAASLRQWESAESLAMRALEIAVRRQENRSAFEAEAHLAYVRTRQSFSRADVRAAPRPRRAFAERLITALGRRPAPAR